MIDSSLVYADEIELVGGPLTLIIDSATFDPSMQLDPAIDQSAEIKYSTDASPGLRQIVARVANDSEIPQFTTMKIGLGDGVLQELKDSWVILLEGILPSTPDTLAKLYLEFSATIEAGVIPPSDVKIEIEIRGLT